MSASISQKKRSCQGIDVARSKMAQPESGNTFGTAANMESTGASQITTEHEDSDAASLVPMSSGSTLGNEAGKQSVLSNNAGKAEAEKGPRKTRCRRTLLLSLARNVFAPILLHGEVLCAKLLTREASAPLLLHGMSWPLCCRNLGLAMLSRVFHLSCALAFFLEPLVRHAGRSRTERSPSPQRNGGRASGSDTRLRSGGGSTARRRERRSARTHGGPYRREPSPRGANSPPGPATRKQVVRRARATLDPTPGPAGACPRPADVVAPVAPGRRVAAAGPGGVGRRAGRSRT